MHCKFLLFGITGNLAKIKILPGLGEFAALNRDKLSVELIGYSRSLPKMDEIEKALNSSLQNVENMEIESVKIENKTQNETFQNTTKTETQNLEKIVQNQIQNGNKKSENQEKIGQNSEENVKINPKHNLTKITFEQGNYEDGRVLFENIAKLQTDERLVVYLAVPPSTFLKFLQNACPYGDQNVDFIIEKPFGRSPLEAQKLLNLVENCGLENQVHFCDHYLFKNSTLLSDLQTRQIQNFFEKTIENTDKNDQNSQDLQNLETIQNQQIEIDIFLHKLVLTNTRPVDDAALEKETLKVETKSEISNTNSPNLTTNSSKNPSSKSTVKLNANPISKVSKIHIQILESVDLVGRAGYFDTTGALKDMWPHLFSLLFLTLETSGFETDFDVEICEVFLGQYQSYGDEEGLSDSATETYFWIKLKVKNEINSEKNTEIILESGKNLPQKITQMTLETFEINNEKNEKIIEQNTTENGKKIVFDGQNNEQNSNTNSKTLKWSIYPNENITLLKTLRKSNINSNSTSLNLNVNLNFDKNHDENNENEIVINLKKEKLDQTNLFELLTFGDKNRFVETEKIQKSWNWWQKINNFIIQNNIQTTIYPDQTLPKKIII